MEHYNCNETSNIITFYMQCPITIYRSYYVTEIKQNNPGL